MGIQVINDRRSAGQRVEVLSLVAGQAALAHVDEVMVELSEAGARCGGQVDPVADALQWGRVVAGEHGWVVEQASCCHHAFRFHKL